jgi:hypothetical protein
MKKVFLAVLIIMAVCCTTVLADSVGDVAYVNQNTTVWADYLNSTTYGSPVTQVNVTIYYPNSSVYVANQTMTQLFTGAWYYSFVPPIEGNFYISAKYYNGITPVGIQTQTLSVIEVDMLQVVIMGFLALLGGLAWVGARTLQQSSFQMFRLLGHLCWVIVGFIIYLMSFMVVEFAEYTPYYGTMLVLFTLVGTIVRFTLYIVGLVVGLMLAYEFFRTMFEYAKTGKFTMREHGISKKKDSYD